MYPSKRRISPLLIGRQSQTTIKGVMHTVLFLAGEMPTSENKSTIQTIDVKLNSCYSATFEYFPNGLEDENFISLSVAVRSVDGSSTCIKFKTSIVTPDGKTWYHFRTDNFRILPNHLLWGVKKLAPIAEIQEKQNYFSPDSMVNFQVTLTVDMNHSRQNNPEGEIPIPKFQHLKRMIYDPTFGDTEFVVGGVKMYGHRELMIRHNEVFKKKFGETAQPRYELPLFNSLLFEELLIDCYWKRNECKETCCSHRSSISSKRKMSMTSAFGYFFVIAQVLYFGNQLFPSSVCPLSYFGKRTKSGVHSSDV